MTPPRMTRITPPHWARPFVEHLDQGFDSQVHASLMEGWADVLRMVHQQVQGHIDEVAGDDGFPVMERMTGEYYLSEAWFRVHRDAACAAADDLPQYRVSIHVRCLEVPSAVAREDRDYLGLEIHFRWRPNEQRLVATGDVDSRSI